MTTHLARHAKKEQVIRANTVEVGVDAPRVQESVNETYGYRASAQHCSRGFRVDRLTIPQARVTYDGQKREGKLLVRATRERAGGGEGGMHPGNLA